MPTRNKPRGLLVYAVCYLIFLYAPVLLLPVFSFNDSAVVAFPLNGFTTRWYVQLWGIPALQEALLASVQVGVAAASLSTCLGLLTARSITRHAFFGKTGMLSLIMLPLVMPEIIVAVALLVVILQSGLELSLITVTLGHILICLPFSVIVLRGSFEGLDKDLEEASLDLGETAMATFFRVILPIVTPGLIASLLLTFTISFDEFILSFFLSGNRPTLPLYIWSQLRFSSRLPSVLALGSLILAFSITLICMAEALRRHLALPGKGTAP